MYIAFEMYFFVTNEMIVLLIQHWPQAQRKAIYVEHSTTRAHYFIFKYQNEVGTYIHQQLV